MGIHRNIFFRIYKWISFLGMDSAPHQTSFIFMVVFSFSNLILITWLSSIFLEIQNPIKSWSYFEVITSMVILGIPHYYSFLAKKKYKEIILFYQKENKSEFIVGNVLAISYVFLSFASPIFIAYHG